MNTIVYVDRPLAIAIAAKLIGVLQTQTQGTTKSASLNWLITTNLGSQSSTARGSDVRELMPEDLVYHFYDAISEKHDKIEQIIGRLSTGTENGFIPGTVISIKGKLVFPDLTLPAAISPFTSPDIDLPTLIFHGEPCIVGQLKSDDYVIPVYFTESAKYQIVFCNNQPVEVTGVLRWVPPYSPNGGRAINLAIRCAALWLR